jgi:hypothetical protein
VGGTEETVFSGRSAVGRSQFQFEPNASDDEMEDELERNLDKIQGLVRNLRVVSTALGEEIDHQNGMLSAMEDKTVKLDERLQNNTAQVRRPYRS